LSDLVPWHGAAPGASLKARITQLFGTFSGPHRADRRPLVKAAPTILSKKREGATFVVHVESKGPGGSQMLSDVTFTPREDKTIDFSDQDQTCKAVLHRCPD